MHCFYCEANNVAGEQITITGSDVNHIKNVLRMERGEELMVCDGTGMQYTCQIADYPAGEVILSVLKAEKASTELPVRLKLYQGLPKKDKMELIIQKAVELGVTEIVPVATKRCVVKLDDKKAASKIVRWQSIAEAAAKQSKRGIIPQVLPVQSFKLALQQAQDLDVRLIPYELASGMEHTRELLGAVRSGQSVAVFIGPEGGFEENEIALAKEYGVEPITLGKRILRTETAGMTVLAWIGYLLEQ